VRHSVISAAYAAQPLELRNSQLALIVSMICTQLNLGHLAPCGWEPVDISLNCPSY